MKRYVHPEETEYSRKYRAWLIRMRTGCKMTQRDVALKVNVTTAAVQRWEYGASLPNCFQARLLRKVFRVKDADTEEFDGINSQAA